MQIHILSDYIILEIPVLKNAATHSKIELKVKTCTEKP